MANNCLVTQLKSEVQNDDILKLGEFVLDVHKLPNNEYTKDGAQFKLSLPGNKTYNIKVKGNGYFVVDWDTIDDPSTHLTSYTLQSIGGIVKLYMANDDFQLIVGSKYDLTYLGNSRGSSPFSSSVIINLKDMEYLTNLKNLNVGLASTIGDTQYLRNLTEMRELNLWSSTVTGHITDLGNMKEATELALHDSYIEGALEDFCNMQVAGTDGRTSGSLTLYCSRSLTYQGSALANRDEKTIRFGSSMVNPTSAETLQGWQIV